MINYVNNDLYTGMDSGKVPNPYTIINNNSFAYGIWEFELISRKGSQLKIIALKNLHRKVVLDELVQLGFCKRISNTDKELFIREDGNIISEVTTKIIQDVFYNSVILGQNDDIKVSFEGIEQEFSAIELRKVYFNVFHLIFNDSFLLHLETHDKKVLRDEKNCSYFFFNNCIIKTTAQGIQTIDYNNIVDECIWEDQIIDYNFNQVSNMECHYSKFIFNVANQEEDRVNSFKSAIGYLLHNHNRSTGGQCVILYDQAPARKGQPEGGTGKGLFANAIKRLRVTAKIDGKKIRSEDKFKWQSIQTTTQIIWIDDVHSKFSFEDLHSNLSDGWTIEKKHQPEIYIPAVDSPKVIIASNTVLSSSGTTNIRRQFILEFSNHYSKHIITGNEEPVKNEHQCVFFDAQDWVNEWTRFYTYMLHCSVYYFKNGLVDYEKKGLIRNQLLQNTCDDFVEWLDANSLLPDTEYNIKTLFEDYKSGYSDDSDIKQNMFSKWIKRYTDYSNLEYTSRSSSGTKFIKLVTKCK
ncbi:MAG: hypothetical protein WCP69_13065 [Bacteroidota bacterium]